MSTTYECTLYYNDASEQLDPTTDKPVDSDGNSLSDSTFEQLGVDCGSELYDEDKTAYWTPAFSCQDPEGNAATCEGDNPAVSSLECKCNAAGEYVLTSFVDSSEIQCSNDQECEDQGLYDENGVGYICLIGQNFQCAPCSESVYASASGETNQVWNMGTCERDCDCVSGHCYTNPNNGNKTCRVPGYGS